MIKVFFALFISFAYAAEFSEPKGRAIERILRCEFDRLNFDTFRHIMTFLTAEEVFNLKFLSQRMYRRVRKLWPEMELSTVVEGSSLGRPVDFSHIVRIHDHGPRYRAFFYRRDISSCLRNFLFLYQRICHEVDRFWSKMNFSTIVYGSHPGPVMDSSHIGKIHDKNMDNSEDQNFFYSRAQLSCLRKFVFSCEDISDLQAVVDLLPRNSLTSLNLMIASPEGYYNLNRMFPVDYSKCSLISKIDFPKLVHLELTGSISLNHDTFSSLSNYMRCLKLDSIFIDVITSSSLARALVTMDRLEVLSLSFCTFTKNGLLTILENLPASLEILDIDCIQLPSLDMRLFELGLKKLREMKCLQEIKFWKTSNELAIEIISNLPECITSISFSINRETINAFQQRLGEFTNVIRVKHPPHVIAPELIPEVLKIFPNLDENSKEALNS